MQKYKLEDFYGKKLIVDYKEVGYVTDFDGEENIIGYNNGLAFPLPTDAQIIISEDKVFITRNTSIKGDEVQKWCEWLHQQPKTQQVAKEDNVTMMLHLLYMIKNHKIEKFDKDPNTLNMLKTDQVVNIVRARYQAITNIELPASVTLLSVLLVPDERPGILVQLASYLAWYKIVNKLENITPEEIILKIFPTGGFSLETYEEAWDKQKFEGSNLLDNPRAWKSLLEYER